MKLLLPIAALMLSACGIDCMETIRYGSELAITDSVEILSCGQDSVNHAAVVTVRMSPSDFAKARAEAQSKGYASVQSLADSVKAFAFQPYMKSDGLAKYMRNPNGSSHFAVIEDSSRKLTVVNMSNFR